MQMGGCQIFAEHSSRLCSRPHLHISEHCMSCWAKLCQRLNAAADKVGAPYHKIELVQRGPTCFFVVCSDSPRFIWNVFLRHLCEAIVAERVFLEYVKGDLDARAEVERFNSVLETI